MIRLLTLLFRAVLLSAIFFAVIELANGSLSLSSFLPNDSQSPAAQTSFPDAATLTSTPTETPSLTPTPSETPTPQPTATPEGPPISVEDFERPFPGVFYKRQTSSSPRPYVAHIVIVDLNRRNIDLFVTPPEGLGQTTSGFLQSYGLQLAINGDGWVNIKDPIGFAAFKGEMYSEDSQEPTIFIAKNGEVRIGGNPPEKKIWYAISASHTLVRNGRLEEKIRTCANQLEFCHNLAPRTSIGLSENNYMIIVVVQGPPSDPHEALTLEELAELHLELGSYDAVAMDGGGSSTLVVDTGSGPQTLNDPSDGSERPVSNHLGIFVRNRDNE